jgi:predicted kinase
VSKSLILLSAPPASGKNFVAELVCRSLESVCYLDKDDLAPLLRRSFDLTGERLDMDGEFYLNNLRPFEYETLINMALSALRFSDKVLVNAPFLREVRDNEYMQSLKARVGEIGAELTVVWVSASPEVCYERMKKRGSDRDAKKLLSFEEYLKKTDYTPPTALLEKGSVHKLFVFANENREEALESLDKLLKILGE